MHARNVAQGIEDFPKLLAQAFRSTKSGGYVELAELGLKIFCDDETLRADNGVKTWSDTLVRAMEKIGRPSPTTEGLKKALETAGFVDVHALVYKQPIGPWPKEPRLKRIGAMNVLSADTGRRRVWGCREGGLC